METAWLFLKGLGLEALEKPDILRNVFTQWGAGESAKVILDPATQAKRGTAIVQMQGVDQVISRTFGLQTGNGSAGPALWRMPHLFSTLFADSGLYSRSQACMVYPMRRGGKRDE